jgi:phosphoenolpyruvate synthase/pyruvate phosphate dikinase
MLQLSRYNRNKRCFMDNKKFLTTSQYARKYGISRMQVIRLIRAGKITAQRVGKNWMIIEKSESINQISLEKTSSLQKWNKIIQSKLNKKLKIETNKDREIIYARLHGLGLPHERCLAFSIGKFPTKTDFEIAVGRLGYPYWISAVPDTQVSYLNRQTKLRLYEIEAGWQFVNKLPEKEKYKIIVSQYPDDPDFKGTVLISPAGYGIAEFITGDRHYIMTRGFTLTDPMLFDQNEIQRYSKTISTAKQKNLYNLVRGVFGHLEIQFGKINKRRYLTFFDYNAEKAYIEIEQVWIDLVHYFKHKKKKQKKVIFGLPASPGKAIGRCVVLHHESVGMFEKVRKGDILVSDTTTPEMTSLLEKVVAVVADLGGVTSHAAIVCRELKIPAVVGTRNATEYLRTGEKLKVDADKGEVKIIGF